MKSGLLVRLSPEVLSLSMRRMTGFALLALFLGGAASAELAPLPQQPQGYGQPGGAMYPPPGQAGGPPMPAAMQQPQNPPSVTLQGNPRYSSGDRVEYNTEQRQAWLEKCEPLREVDFKGFKRCFETEKRKSADDLKRRFREVESRQGQPYRNVGPAGGALDENPRNPAFDVENE